MFSSSDKSVQYSTVAVQALRNAPSIYEPNHKFLLSIFVYLLSAFRFFFVQQ
jgi:hypothetical protein